MEVEMEDQGSRSVPGKIVRPYLKNKLKAKRAGAFCSSGRTFA
jgi:hypothetical protein